MAGNLVIGATVDVETLKSGFDTGAEVVKSGTQIMGVSFQELSTTASRASRQITEDTKAAAASISSDWQKAAEASFAYTRAQQEVRAASVLVRESAGEDANAIAVLAAAQQRAAAAATERATAQRAAATVDQAAALSSLSAAEQLQLSLLSQAAAMRTIPVAAESAGAGIAAAFRAAYTSVTESLAGIGEGLAVVRERMVETAETAGLSAEGMTAAFAGLSSLLGAGIAVGFAAHFIDESAKVQVELKHLNEATGISIETLAGLRAVVQQAGGDFEPFQAGLIRLERAQTLAIEGYKAQIAAFQRLGIELNELKNLTPEELFFRVSSAMAEVKSHGDDAASAIALFGKGGAALIPVIRELGGTLREQSAEAGKASGITKESVEAAAEWEKMTAQLSQTFHSAMIPVLEFMIPLIKGVRTGFESVATVLITAGEAVATFLVGTTKGFEGLSKITADVISGNWGAIVTDAQAARTSVTDAFSDGGKEIKANWTALSAELKGIWSSGDIKGPQLDKGSDTPGGTAPVKDTRMEDWKRQLQAMQDQEDGFHKLSLSDEAAFWEQKLALARGTPKLYAEVYHQMREAQRKEQQESLKDDAEQTRLAVSSEQRGSDQRLVIIREFLQHMHEMHAEQTEEFKQFSRMEAEEVRANEDQKKKLVMDAELAKIGATKSGTAENVRVISEAMSVIAQLYGKDSTEYKRMQKEKNRAQLEFAQKSKEAQQIELESDRNHQIALLNLQKEEINQAEALGQISKQKRITLLTALENEEFRIAEEALQRKLALMRLDPTLSPDMIARVQAQIVALTDAHNQRLLQLDNQSLTERARKYQQFFSQINSGFANAITGMMQHSETFAQGMIQVWNGMVANFVQALSGMVLKWIESHLLMLLVHTTTNEAEVASDASAAAQKQGISLASTLKQVTHDAVKAATGAYSAVVGIPVIGPILAPIAAGVAFAGVEAFGALASASGGALLGKDTIVSAHKDEMILPARLSTGLQGIINSSSRNLSSSVSSQSSSSTNHIRISPEIHYHGADAPRQTEDDIAAMLQRAMRRGLVPSY